MGSSGHTEQSGLKTGHAGEKQKQTRKLKREISLPLPPMFLVPFLSLCMHITFRVLIDLYVGKHNLDNLLLKEF